MRLYKVFSIAIILVFLAFAIVFNTFPRSEYSELEKRELETEHKAVRDRIIARKQAELDAFLAESENAKRSFIQRGGIIKGLE